jgi:hypothetical protein
VRLKRCAAVGSESRRPIVWRRPTVRHRRCGQRCHRRLIDAFEPAVRANIVCSTSDHEAEMENTRDFARYPAAAEGSGGLQQVPEVRRQVRKAPEPTVPTTAIQQRNSGT